jgi:hypothetical protein
MQPAPEPFEERMLQIRPTGVPRDAMDEGPDNINQRCRQIDHAFSPQGHAGGQ